MLLEKAKVDSFVENNPNWSLGEKELIASLEFENFSEAIAFVVRVGILAEKQGHHPDIKIHSWNKVNITLSTHSEGGITGKDLELAEEINNFL